MTSSDATYARAARALRVAKAVVKVVVKVVAKVVAKPPRAGAARPEAASVPTARPLPPRSRPKAPDQSLPTRRDFPHAQNRTEARHARVAP